MIKVGLTGGIGSGKSLVAKMFSRFGVPVYDSDSAAKQLYITDAVLKQQIINSFGEQCYLTNGKLNKEYLRQLIFNNREKLELINKIVHPRVKLDFDAWLRMYSGVDYIMKEAAILIESGGHKQLDKIIVVSAPSMVRAERVAGRDGLSNQEVKKRINSQMSEDERLKFADFVIVNDGKKALLPQIIKLHEIFSKREKL